MFVLSILSILILAGLAIWSGFDLCKYKALKFLPVKIPFLVVSLLVIYMSIPFWLLAAAYKVDDNAKAETFYNLAIKTSLFPSVKALLYSEKGSYYSMNFNGGKAIDAYEKSYAVKKDDIALTQLCLLYTIKGDYDKAIATCVQTSHNQMAAINSILNKNYTLALNVINIELENDKPSCWDYAVRGYIYRALDKKVLSQSDFDTAFEMCPENNRLNELYENENYYEEHYTNLRKKYHF